MTRYIAWTPKEGPFPFTVADSEGAALENLRIARGERRTLVHPSPANKPIAIRAPAETPDLYFGRAAR